MLSDTEEALTDADKAGAFGASSNPNAASFLITAHNNDQQLGEGMDEDSTSFNDFPNTAEEDAYNGACWRWSTTSNAPALPHLSKQRRLSQLTWGTLS
ncbi:hypothetical protein MRX96_041362 [Rhipicephalus microplus]